MDNQDDSITGEVGNPLNAFHYNVLEAVQIGMDGIQQTMSEFCQNMDNKFTLLSNLMEEAANLKNEIEHQVIQETKRYDHAVIFIKSFRYLMQSRLLD